MFLDLILLSAISCGMEMYLQPLVLFIAPVILFMFIITCGEQKQMRSRKELKIRYAERQDLNHSAPHSHHLCFTPGVLASARVVRVFSCVERVYE